MKGEKKDKLTIDKILQVDNLKNMLDELAEKTEDINYIIALWHDSGGVHIRTLSSSASETIGFLELAKTIILRDETEDRADEA